ncbi:conserved hypothetical protein [Trichinella spiralis]|uniref:hypothetical protein n=1 Tax=Trichinella spiralis TaxID=6334 RepID=UPI0001EFCC99|nr:conserved hypothetical protein [Trichinella spiralis]
MGRRAGKSVSKLVSRFIIGLASKELHQELCLRELAALTKTRQLAERVTEIEEGWRRTVDDAASGNGRLTCNPHGGQWSASSKVNGLEISLLLDCGAVVSIVPLSTWHKSTNGSYALSKGSILLCEGRKVRLCSQGMWSLQIRNWRGRIYVAVVESLVVPGILGTNFFNQFVKVIDWQAWEMTMTDGSRVRIVRKPAQAARPSIECAWITPGPWEVPLEETVREGPETNNGDLEEWGRSLVDGAECSPRVSRYAIRLVQRPANVPVPDGDRSERSDLEDLRRLVGQHHRLRHTVTQHGIGTDLEGPGDPGRHPQPPIRGPPGCDEDAGKGTPAISLASATGRRRGLVQGMPDVRCTGGPDKEAPGPYASPSGRLPYPTGGYGHSGAPGRNAEREPVHLSGMRLLLEVAEGVCAAKRGGAYRGYGADLLAKASIDHPDDWDAHLDGVLLAYQSSVHHTAGATPSQIVFSRELRLPIDLVYGLLRDMPEQSVGEYTQRLRQDLERLYETVRGRAGREQGRQKFWRDQKAHGPVYKPGDRVWMQVPTKTELGAYWDSPYEVQKKLD